MYNHTPSDEFRKIADLLEEISKNQATDSDSEETDSTSIDKTVSDLMTTEKEPEKLSGSVNVESLAKDLGINDVSAFKAAFNSLKQGKMPASKSQVVSLATAFDKLLAADASTTSRILSKLRQIHRSSEH